MTTPPFYRGLAIAASPDLEDDVLQQFLASPKFEWMLSDVVGEPWVEEQHEVEERFEAE